MFLVYLSLFLLPVYLYGVVCFWRYSVLTSQACSCSADWPVCLERSPVWSA